MSLKNDYNRILGKAWQDVSFDQIFSVDPNDAAIACRHIWKVNMGTVLPYKIQFTSGNRNTWVRRKVLYINPEEGWREINHSWSHWVSFRVGNRKPHCDAHLEIERAGAVYIIDRFIK